MIGDYMTKPLTSRKVIAFRKKIMNFVSVGQQECGRDPRKKNQTNKHGK
jgi:hypothetical protein